MSKPRHPLLILNLLEEGKLVSYFLQTQSCVLLLAVRAHLRLSLQSRRDAVPAHKLWVNSLNTNNQLSLISICKLNFQILEKQIF